MFLHRREFSVRAPFAPPTIAKASGTGPTTIVRPHDVVGPLTIALSEGATTDTPQSRSLCQLWNDAQTVCESTHRWARAPGQADEPPDRTLFHDGAVQARSPVVGDDTN